MLFPLLGFLVVAGVAGFLAWDSHVMNVATIEPEGWSEPADYLCLVMPLRLVD